MALLGISILLASLTYIVYRTQGSSWLSRFTRLTLPVESDATDTAHRLPEEKQERILSQQSADDEKGRFRSEDKTSTPSFEISVQSTPEPAQTSTEPPLSTPKQDAPKPPKSPASQLMPPPPRPAPPILRSTPLSTSNSLRAPSSGPLPNRLPAGRSSNSLAPSSTIHQSRLPTPGTGRQKVLLKPGHSPLDWAALTRLGKNLAGVPHFLRVSPAELAYNNGRKGKPAWSLWRGKVYNITPYLPFHPGGEGELMRGAGKDAEKLFMEAHPWVNWENMLNECLVGFLVEPVEAGKESGGGLDDMD